MIGYRLLKGPREEMMKDQITGLTLVEHSVRLERREDAALILTSDVPLDPVVAHTGVWLEK